MRVLKNHFVYQNSRINTTGWWSDSFFKFKMSLKRQSETNIVDFEEEINSDDEYELDEEEGDVSWLFREYEESSDEEFDSSGINIL